MSVFGGIRRIAGGESRIDFVGRARLWFVVSAVMMLVSVLGLTVKGLNLGLEFKGGSSFRVPVGDTAQIPSVPAVQDALAAVGVSEARVQIARPRSGGGVPNVLVQARHIENRAEVIKALADVARQPDVNLVSAQDVGPKWGRQISNKALWSLIIFLILVVIYISLTFEPKMAVAAIAAVVHDVLVTSGIYALVGFQVTPATVIALLTILGYSLYDDVVVFDKVRENVNALGASSKTTYSETINRSVNQVLMRSINTSLTSLLPVGGLLIVGAVLLGAATLKDLALSLFVGITVGTYSSIFFAIPIIAVWKEREPRYRQIRARSAARPVVAAASAKSGLPAQAPSAAEPTPESGESEVPEAPRPARPAPAGTQRRQTKPRGRKRGRARRRR